MRRCLSIGNHVAPSVCTSHFSWPSIYWSSATYFIQPFDEVVCMADLFVEVHRVADSDRGNHCSGVSRQLCVPLVMNLDKCFLCFTLDSGLLDALFASISFCVYGVVHSMMHVPSIQFSLMMQAFRRDAILFLFVTNSLHSVRTFLLSNPYQGLAFIASHVLRFLLSTTRSCLSTFRADLYATRLSSS